MGGGLFDIIFSDGSSGAPDDPRGAGKEVCMALFSFSIPRDIVYGDGALARLATLKGRKAALVTGGSSMRKLGFLDQAAAWILEMDNGHGYPWKGNYSSWVEQKEKQLEQKE